MRAAAISVGALLLIGGDARSKEKGGVEQIDRPRPAVPGGERVGVRVLASPEIAALPTQAPDPSKLPRVPGSRTAKQRGVALGLFAEDVSFSYAPLLEEIAALGASHVALVVPIYQTHGGSVTLRLHTRLSPTLGATAEAVRAARRAGLEVSLFPIVRLEAPRGPEEWRGTLAPANRDAWFRSYQTILGDLAAIATLTGVSRLVVGSELSSLDADLDRWRPLLEKIRAVFPGTLVYSANWDHYRDAKLFELVDELGVVAYFNLREKDAPSDVEALAGRWQSLRAEIEGWLRGRDKPFVFTEVGYRSRAGATAAPWDETAGGTADPEEQRRGFAAFRRAWTSPPSPLLDGVYVWNWYGFGGPTTISYTPRGKPAVDEVKQLLEAL
jgi:hypothetical protein